MMSISNITASAFSGSQELVAALAHLNFDFSLVKIEAPMEFKALGAAISTNRREIAENGSLHVTARKLGSLFGPIIPDTPKLVEVYGKRASEIARSPLYNPQATPNEGIFADYIGADGTSIWAAATSGVYSIAMHLLATMLARMWTASEATSIWVEIVAARKKELAETVDHKMDLTTALAAQIVLERESLAEWDNSARAWLRRADEAKKREQTQLMLILNNLSIDIPRKLSTYSSVMGALKSALCTMEDLISGTPLGVDEGSVLLALSCWHIYPDMIVMGDRTIVQGDPLVPETGKLTLGLENGPNRKSQGVYWCLSLSRMKFYGAPVTSESSLATSSGRLSSEQFMCVALGAVLRSWKYKMVNLAEVSKVLIALYQNMSKATDRVSRCSLGVSPEKSALRDLDEHWRKNFQTKPNWIRNLAETAKDLASAEGLERALGMKLVSLGQERGSSFLAEANSSPSPVFGLSEFDNILPLLESDEDRIALLRKYALQFFPGAKPSDVIICYKIDSDRNFIPAPDVSQDMQDAQKNIPKDSEVDETNTKVLPSKERNTPRPIPTFVFTETEDDELPAGRRSKKTPKDRSAKSAIEYASGLPFELPSSSPCKLQYGRWVDSEQVPAPSCKSLLFPQKSQAPERTKSMPINTATSESCSPEMGADTGDHSPFLDASEVSCEKSATLVPGNFPERAIEKETDSVSNPSLPSKVEILEAGDDDSASSIMDSTDKKTLVDVEELDTSRLIDDDEFFQEVPKLINYKLFLGDPNIAAIYVRPSVFASYEESSRNTHWPYKKVVRQRRLNLEDIIKILNDGAISSQALDRYFRDVSSKNYYTSLRLLSFIQEIYKPLSKATIDSNVILKPLYSRPWANTHGTLSYLGESFSREQTFACIAMLETGIVDLAAWDYANVFALSSANSLFVAAPLLCDPSELCLPYEIRHIVGNIGKPGLTLLVPPSTPEFLKPSVENWHLINRLPYDGELIDNFADTSLHLNISGSQLPINLGDQYRGRCDAEASLVEAFISVHNRDKWIADLDILTALKRGHSQADHEFYYKPICEHVRARALHMAAAAKSGNVIVSDLGSVGEPGSDENVACQEQCENNDAEKTGSSDDDKDAEVIGLNKEMEEYLGANNIHQEQIATTILGSEEFSYTSIDSWEEFLSPPEGPSVVRAHGNWLARIATTVLAVQRHDRVLVNERPCFFCVKNIEDVGGTSYTDKVVFIC